MSEKTSVFANGTVWFGAAVSVAEIEAGIQSGNNGAALVLGHLLGGLMLFAVGLVGARFRVNAMESCAGTFGGLGAKFFALLNLFQLVGWTAVMISQGAGAVKTLLNESFEIPFANANSMSSFVLWCIVLATLVAVWIFVGLKKFSKVATCALALLALLMAVLSFKLFGGDFAANAADVTNVSAGAVSGGSFWVVFEMSVAMPLSWLPLIADYTKNAEHPVAATATSAAVYTFTSLWMYAIGMAIAATSVPTLSGAVLAVGLGAVGVIIVIFSTVTTTFLDAYSAGESAKTIYRKLNAKWTGAAVCLVGALLAISGIIERYTDFLYLIASVFAPMAAVLIVSHYVVRRADVFCKNANVFCKNAERGDQYAECCNEKCAIKRRVQFAWNVFAWLAGFMAYQLAGESTIGPSLTAILVSAGVAFFFCLPRLYRIIYRACT